MRWQSFLKENITDLQSLLDFLEIPPESRSSFSQEDYGFPLMVPRHFASLMEKGNLHDPLLKQVIPVHAEALRKSGFSLDPLKEQEFNPVPGCLHKYHGRVLIITTGQCAINCRYCFRRHFPYGEQKLGTADWEKIVAYIRADSSIREVILSGGEPFIMTDSKLAAQIKILSEISHVDTIRFHTRMLITLPSRMGESLFNWVSDITQARLVMVFHVNHAQELHPLLKPLLKRLNQLGVVLLNQSVLLKGVNDQVDILEQLSRTLFSYGILPYYLHQLDPVQGAQHFEVPLKEGRALHKALKARCPGYLVPKYVAELAGLPYKESLDQPTA